MKHRVRLDLTDKVSRFSLISVIIVATVCVVQPIRAEQTALDRQSEQLDKQEHLLLTTINVAERTCLTNLTSSQERSVRLKIDAIMHSLSSSVGLAQKTEQVRGAARDLPAAVRVVEDDKIRSCMNTIVRPVFAMVVETYRPAASNSAWPDPIDFRFNFVRGPSKDSQRYTEFLRLNLHTHNRQLSRRLAMQDPQAEAYFDYDISYPEPSEMFRGTIVAEIKGDARLTTASPAITDVCLRRSTSLPTGQGIDYDLFDCVEGKTCLPATRTTGWLQACPSPTTPVRAASTSPYLQRVAYPSVVSDETTTAAPDTLHWTVPSLEALTDRNVEGVGYTIFTLETDAFRRSNVRAVEVDLRANNIPVLEDGLTPDLRPVNNDPATRFSHTFALQTLDLEGSDGGCDRIEVRLRPIQADGRKGNEQTSILTYVALRDVAPRVQRLGEGELTWSASYVTPQREWRHIAELHSYIYSTVDPVARNRAVQQAITDKTWMDGLGLTYDRQRVVGVIRPPRTVQHDGTAAFGLAAGLIQPNGQVRFTFSEDDAGKLSAFMIEHRGLSERAAGVIDPKPYIFQAVGGSRTVPGVCGVS